MKPAPFAPVIPTIFRRSVRALAWVVPALLTTLACAETWTGTDIGSTGAAGGQGTAPNDLPPRFTLVGAGADIQGTADSFRLLHTPVTGDVVAMTQVTYMSSTHPWAKAGVMVRASLDANSANVAMVLSPGQPCSLQVRPAAGAATDVVLGPRLSLPYWVKVTRAGNTFTGSVSPDGVAWTLIGSREVVLPASVYAGFAACSHVTGTTLAASFERADINGSSIPPPLPSNVSATSVTPHSAGITWTDNSTAEDGFRIYVWRDERHATYPQLWGTVAANVTSFTITGLAAESYYHVAVRGFRGGAQFPADSDTSLSVHTPQNPNQPPTTPSMRSIQPSAPNAIDVSWTETGGLDSGYETGFELERSSDGSPFTRIATLGENVLGYRDTGLTAGTTYTYRVRAVKETLYSGYSQQVSTQAKGPLPAPTGLAIDSLTTTSLHLTWTDNSSDETGFVIDRSIAGGEFQWLATTAPNTTSYADSHLAPNTTYSYRVRAVHSFASDYSNVATVTTPADDTPPPSGWIFYSIGSGQPGHVNNVPPTFQMDAGGSDIQGTEDSFAYSTETASGDVTLVCRIASMTNTNPWAKAGVMIRASVAPGAANVAMLLSPAQVCSFQVRAATGSATDVTTGSWVTPPYWVKLTRVGNIFTGYVSPDGSLWTQVGTRNIVLPTQVYIGFAGSSHDVNVRTTIAFDHADVAGSTPPPPPPGPEWTQRAWGAGGATFTPAPADDAVAAMTVTSGDIYGATDSGAFVQRQASGSVTLVTRVESVSRSDDWAKAGLMIRASLDANAANAFVALTPGVGAVFQSRSATSGALTTTVGHTWGAGPGTLLKLVRGGGTISAFFSTDNGTSWTSLGSVTDDLPATIYVGYAAASHNPSVSTTANFAQP